MTVEIWVARAAVLLAIAAGYAGLRALEGRERSPDEVIADVLEDVDEE